MCDKIKLLIVEDNESQQKAYNDSIDLFNEKSEIKIEVEIKNNYEESIKLLEWHVFDAAIIDLKLNGTDLVGEGNKIIKIIKNKLRFPIFVVTGFPDDLDMDLREPNIFFKIYKRDGIKYIEIFNEIATIYKSGATKILGGRGIIEGYLTNIFWNNLSSTIDTWYKEKNPEKMLLRYTLTHLLEYLELDESGVFEKYQATEVYIKPPLRTKILTGDILVNKKDKNNFIVLSPICDLAQDKSKFLIISMIEPINSGIINCQRNIILKNVGEKKAREAEEILKKIINNNFANKYYFLPPSINYSGGLINFQKIFSYKINEVNENFDFIASISHQFVKDIIAKFSFYYSRQGSPDFDEEKIYDEILK
jgi:hypothetical protein